LMKMECGLGSHYNTTIVSEMAVQVIGKGLLYNALSPQEAHFDTTDT